MPVFTKVSSQMESLHLREALLQEPTGERIRCNTCERRCAIIPGGWGWCRTRQNLDGRLVSHIFGLVSSLSANPIEKKLFYHFYPGTFALTAGSWSCNFGCPWCQNWSISKQPPGKGEYISPDRFVEMTLRASCQGTSISFNEPTLSLEWSLDVFRLARRRGLYNTYVTNGYMTPEALSRLVEAGLDALNVDVKGDAPTVRKYCKGVDVDKVWNTCRLARTHGLHLEITTLVIPTVNDGEDSLGAVAEHIVTELGAQVPWHVSGYHPAYRFHVGATPVSTLERAWTIGNQAGLDFVYIGNAPGHRCNHTYCPACGALLIRRSGFDVVTNHIHAGRCSHCDQCIPGIW
jgi:pyruvate formate lyase activating enzyme